MSEEEGATSAPALFTPLTGIVPKARQRDFFCFGKDERRVGEHNEKKNYKAGEWNKRCKKE